METDPEPKFVNTWRPVTSEWQEAEIPAIVAIVPPEVKSKLAVAASSKRAVRKARTPLLIAVYAGYCFLRAGILMAGLWTVLYVPESEATKLIYAQTVPAIERILDPGIVHKGTQVPDSDFDREQAEAGREIALRATPGLLVMVGVSYAVSGVMWLLRSKMARFWTMWSAGFSALSATVSWLILTFVYPHGAKLSSAHTAGPDLLLPGILLNLFVFLYLAYSPSILEAFRVGED